MIALLALLVSLLFPAISNARESANRAACLMNLKQISVGVKLQFTEYYPGMPYRGMDCEAWGKAAQDLLPYAGKNTDLFDCPSNPGIVKISSGFNSTELPDYPGVYTDYEFNGYISRCRAVGSWEYNRFQTAIKDPSITAYSWDFPYRPDAPQRAHAGGINIAYMDGHAKWVDDEKLGAYEPHDPMAFYRIGHPFDGDDY